MPQPSESFTMPTGNRGRVDQHEPVLPAGPPPAQAHPEKTVGRAEASIRPAEYGQLMAERHQLEERSRRVDSAARSAETMNASHTAGRMSRQPRQRQRYFVSFARTSILANECVQKRQT